MKYNKQIVIVHAEHFERIHINIISHTVWFICHSDCCWMNDGFHQTEKFFAHPKKDLSVHSKAVVHKL